MSSSRLFAAIKLAGALHQVKSSFKKVKPFQEFPDVSLIAERGLTPEL